MALDYLHDNNVVHADIRLENILIDGKITLNSNKILDMSETCDCNDHAVGPSIKLIDFQHAHHFNDRLIFNNNEKGQYYQAPEFYHKQMFNSKIDVWSACIIIYILLTGKLPNYNREKFNLS